MSSPSTDSTPTPTAGDDRSATSGATPGVAAPRVATPGVATPEPGGPLLARLEAIAGALARRPDALALLALGSVGRERDRLDAHSDLDFFVLVRPESKPGYVAELDWLAEAHPVAFHFRNTVDGHKVLFADGIFAEMAVFHPGELATIPYSPGRFVWRREEVDPALATPAREAPAQAPDPDWLLGELLTNLLVGLHRYHRGERLSAARLVQSHAVDRLLELLEHPSTAAASVTADTAATDPAARRDGFARERRVERRLPWLTAHLPALVPGYDRTPEAAAAMLSLLATRFPLDPALTHAIRALLPR